VTILSCSAIEPFTHLFASFIFVIAFAEFILGLTDGRTLASLFCCSNFLFGLTLSQVSDIHVNKVYIYICNHPTFKLRDIMPFYVTHECAELPPSSQGRQEGSGRRATRIPSDPDATQREEPRHKLVVAMGGECDPALHPAPPKSPAELGKNPAGVSVTVPSWRTAENIGLDSQFGRKRPVGVLIGLVSVGTRHRGLKFPFGEKDSGEWAGSRLPRSTVQPYSVGSRPVPVRVREKT
jgi:hypothetical protein